MSHIPSLAASQYAAKWLKWHLCFFLKLLDFFGITKTNVVFPMMQESMCCKMLVQDMTLHTKQPMSCFALTTSHPLVYLGVHRQHRGLDSGDGRPERSFVHEAITIIAIVAIGAIGIIFLSSSWHDHCVTNHEKDADSNTQ